ncbi:MAG: hypothetical protein IJK15_05140 [Bacteroidaceae bacterium]|nr:hypothetical protein [Bacteroidaceae bacterium]
MDHHGDSPYATVRIALRDRSHRPARPFASPYATVRIALRDHSHHPARPFSILLRDAQAQLQSRYFNLICAHKAFDFAQAYLLDMS